MVADLATIYQSKDKDLIDSQIAALMNPEVPKLKKLDIDLVAPVSKEALKESFIALDKGQNDPPEPIAPSPRMTKISIEELIKMAGAKMDLSQERIDEFVESLKESDVECEEDLDNASHGKLRAWGLSDGLIVKLK